MTKNKLNNINETGFKVPKDYFSQVEEQLLSEVRLRSKTETSGFEVPNSYFDSVEQRILETVANENDSKVVSLFPWKKVFYTTAVAASIILMFNLYIKSPEAISFDTIETASIENYLDNEELSSYELALLLTEDELNTDNFIDDEIPESSIENYLLENVDLENLIIEQ